MTAGNMWTWDEALDAIERMQGPERLVAELMLTTGQSLSAVLNLRIHDLDLCRCCLQVRQDGHRIPVSFPDVLRDAVRDQLSLATTIYEHDRARYVNRHRRQPDMRLPSFWLFADDEPADVPEPAERGPLAQYRFSHALLSSARAAGITKPVHSHTLRHCHARWKLDAGIPVDELRRSMGHADPMTTLLYTQSLTFGGLRYTQSAA